MNEKKSEWQAIPRHLRLRSIELEDNYFELTNGEIHLASQDDSEDTKTTLQAVAEALNRSDVKLANLDAEAEGVDNFLLKEENKTLIALKDEIEKSEKEMATVLENLMHAARMAEQELVFGGNWKIAQIQLNKNIAKAKSVLEKHKEEIKSNSSYNETKP